MKMSLRHQRIIVLLLGVVFIGLLLVFVEGSVDYWLSFWWMLPIAFIISLLVNTIGISGAALFVPFFVLLFPLLARSLTGLQSVELGLITESFGLLSSALAFSAFGLIDKVIAKQTIKFVFPFLLIGVVLTAYVPDTVLLLMVAGLLSISSIFLLFERRLTERHNREHGAVEVKAHHATEREAVVLQSADGRTYRYNRNAQGGVAKRLAGYGTGAFFQGAVGFGIGEIGVVSMILSHIPIRIAIGTSHLITATTAIIASVSHFTLSIWGHAAPEPLPWNILIMTVPAVLMAGQISPFVAAKLPNRLLEKLVAVLFLGIAFLLIGVIVQR